MRGILFSIYLVETISFVLQFMCISYLLNLLWIGMFGIGIVPVVVYLMVSSRCDNSIYSKDQVNTCINLNHYGKSVV